MSSASFENAFRVELRNAQGLKPSFFGARGGTAEAVPFPKSTFETRSSLVAADLRIQFQECHFDHKT